MTTLRVEGKSTQRNFVRERLRPEVQPLTLLYTTLDRQDTLFAYPSLTNSIPFTYWFRKLHPFLTPVNTPSFKYE